MKLAANAEPLTAMQQQQQRWFAFLEKLAQRMNELGEAAIPELNTAFAADPDEFHRAYLRMRAGITGQFDSIRIKADQAFTENVLDFALQDASLLASHQNDLFQFQETCRRRHSEFEQQYRTWLDRIAATQNEDFEAKYRQILDEFERTRNSFHCIQCGAPIPLEQIYFVTTYLACPACKTQNTYTPSTQASRLEHIGRSLAEQRAKPLLTVSEQQRDRERHLYQQAHKLGLGNIHEHDASRREETSRQIAAIHEQRKEAIRTSQTLYRQYLRRMFDEWNTIVPALTAQNEKFYARMLNEFEARVHDDNQTDNL